MPAVLDTTTLNCPFHNIRLSLRMPYSCISSTSTTLMMAELGRRRTGHERQHVISLGLYEDVGADETTNFDQDILCSTSVSESEHRTATATATPCLWKLQRDSMSTKAFLENRNVVSGFWYWAHRLSILLAYVGPRGFDLAHSGLAKACLRRIVSLSAVGSLTTPALLDSAHGDSKSQRKTPSQVKSCQVKALFGGETLPTILGRFAGVTTLALRCAPTSIHRPACLSGFSAVRVDQPFGRSYT